MNIDELPVRQLDAAIHQEMFGATMQIQKLGRRGGIGYFDGGLPYYSADIAVAWLVVEKMRADGWDMTLVQTAKMQHDPWDCRFFIAEYKRAIDHGSTAPLAICRAALGAVRA